MLPTDENDAGAGFSTEDYLKFAQMKRVRFINAIDSATETEEGLALLDPDRQSNYLKAIADLEKQVLVLEKMKQEEKNNDANNAVIAALILEQSKKMNMNRSRELVEPMDILPDPSLLPVKNLVPGELEIGDRIESYAAYKTRTGQSSDPNPQQDGQG